VTSPESFFAPLPAPHHHEADPQPVYPDVPWQVPMNVVGVPIALRLGMAQSADTLVVLSHAVVFPRGLTLTVESWVRPGTELAEAGRSWEALRPRFGVLLDDGTKVGHDPSRAWTQTEDPVGPGGEVVPGLMQVDGSAGLLTTSTTWWLYPFPGGLTMDVVVAWPERGIAEAFTSVDLAPMHSAAMLAEPLWPLPAPPRESGWVTFGAPLGSTEPERTGGRVPGTDPADPGIPPSL
jgi:hypothetical protein